MNASIEKNRQTGSPPEAIPSEARFNSREAADYLGCSLGHIYKLTSRRAVPHYKPGGKRLLFLKSDLDAYLLRNRIEREDDSASPDGSPSE